VLPALEKEIENCAKHQTPIKEGSRWSKKRAYTLLVLDNYNEAVLILRRILSAFKELGEVERLRTKPKLPEQQRETLRARQYDLLSFLQLDTKALYLWTAQITGVFQHSGEKIDLSELERISLFRHKLMTHVHQTPFFKSSLTMKSGIIHNPDKEVFHDFYQSFDLDLRNSRFAGLHTLVQKARLFVPEVGKKWNRFETIEILYQHINRISDRKLQREIMKFIFKVGLPTDSPGVIADALLEALRAFDSRVKKRSRRI